MYHFNYCIVQQKTSKLQYFAKKLGTSFSMQSNSKSFYFSVHYNARAKIISSSNVFLSSVLLNVSLKKYFYIYTTVVVRVLCL